MNEVTHACPSEGSGIMPCCKRTPFEVPRTDRITLDASLVTCRSIVNDREVFRVERVGRMQEVSDLLLPAARRAAEGNPDLLEQMLHTLFIEEFGQIKEFALFDSPNRAFRWFMSKIKPGLKKAEGASPERIADWLGTALVNAAQVAREGGQGKRKMWLSRRDDKVRPFHVEADGQMKAWDEPFVVCDGIEMLFPGEPVGDPACWINCRCVAAPSQMVASAEEVRMSQVMPEVDDELDVIDDMPDELLYDDNEGDDEMPLPPPIPWHGVLVPEGVNSGDGRSFSPGALTWRDLPLPLRVQSKDTGAHDGAVIAGTIDNMGRDSGVIKSNGRFLDGIEADEIIGLIAEGAAGGVSVDVDDVELAQDAGDNVRFTKGRICAATLVHIPAFPGAYIALGDWPEDGQMVTSDTTVDDVTPAPPADESFAISEKPWDGDAARFTPEEYKRSCILHRSDSLNKSEHSLPIKEPNGDLSRAGVHAAASRIGQVKDATPAQIAAAKRALRGAYRQLGEDVPEGLAASAEEFTRGPGWVTHPRATRRIHAYWTQPGHKGYAQIRWGQPGDFNRLKRALAKYVKPEFLNRVAAQWHHDALGIWPGQHKREKVHATSETLAQINIVASSCPVLPHEWFCDPKLTEPTAIKVDGDRMYGHLALWDTCHIGIKGVCTTPPKSAQNYAYFRTGAVETTEGRVSVGRITLDTGHAPLSRTALGAKAHYDDTGTCVADVACGEDEFGIWVAGAMRPRVTAEDRRVLAASPLSGDWRDIGGNLELVAALAVNTPGFPITRPLVAASEGVQTALIAPGQKVEKLQLDPWTTEVISETVSQMLGEHENRKRRRERLDALKHTMNKERVAAVTEVFSDV